MTYYAGLDVSLRSTHICVIDDEGELLAEGKTDSEVADIIEFIDELNVEIAGVGLEAGTLTQYLTYGLQFAGYEVACMEARQVKAALSAMRNKTDKNDARGIAQLLRSGWYSRVHVKSIVQSQGGARQVHRFGAGDPRPLQGLRHKVTAQARAWRVRPEGAATDRGKVRPLIEADEALSHALLPMLDARLVLYHSFRELDNRTRHMANDDPTCQRLMTAPGVGFVTALTFKAGVDDPTRFKRSRTVAAHFGLTPRRFQSGEIDFDGHISRAGDANVRATLYVAANSMMTRSSQWSPLKAWGMKLAKSRGHKRAVIAVARKLAVILHRMWIDDTRFQWSTEAARS
jgi:transposase